MPAEIPQQLSRAEAETHAQIIQYVYGPRINAGVISYDEGARLTADNIEIARTLDNESLLAAHMGVSDIVLEMDGMDEGEMTQSRQDEVADAYISTGKTIAAMPFIDAGRAEGLYAEVLKNPAGHRETLPFVFTGMSNLTLLKGKSALPLWQEAKQNAKDSDTRLMLALAIHGTGNRIKAELDFAKHHPDSMPRNFDISRSLLKKFG